eukprot:GHVQ01004643.1.p1 GENE.GHVQ01004643.1~~GHVQ01004643.1.p1  ORF type:complete len:148 (+),score=32.40 GHVQ01004643.1:611-1054(+)
MKTVLLCLCLFIFVGDDVTTSNAIQIGSKATVPGNNGSTSDDTPVDDQTDTLASQVIESAPPPSNIVEAAPPSSIQVSDGTQHFMTRSRRTPRTTTSGDTNRYHRHRRGTGGGKTGSAGGILAGLTQVPYETRKQKDRRRFFKSLRN